MAYYLSLLTTKGFSLFNIFQYITFRSFCSILTAFFISLIISPYIIKKIKDLNIYEKIREDGPRHSHKIGTPTMGGIILFISILVSNLIWTRLDNRFIILMFASTIYLGVLGFIDDYLKLKKHNPKKGLIAAKKIIWQLIFAIGITTYIHFYPPNATYAKTLNIPFLKDCFINIGILYLVLTVFIIVGSSNAVNLTDGLDGLAIGCIIFSCLTYMVFAYVTGHVEFSKYLKIIYVPGGGELVVFLASVVGAGLGFLWINSYPAQIFMGDTGALLLGGIIGITAILIKHELLLIIVGGVFVIEALSVIIQVGFFQLKRKRVFLMAPLHHHFEMLGYKEPKVVIRFWIVSIMLSLIALSALKLR